MRILHVTDSHLGTERHVPGAPAGYLRHHDHLRALREALAPAFRGEVDLVVHSGDLFDRSRPPLRVMADGAALLAEVVRRTPMVLVNGNHDWRGYRRALPLPPPGLTVVDRPTRVVVGGVALAVVPFAREAGAWAEAARVAAGPGVDLLVAHQAFDGAAVPGLTFRVGAQADTIGPAHLPPGVQHVLCGHIHTRQRIVVGEASVVMPGSTERTSFRERDEPKGSAIWSLEGSISQRFVDGPTRPMVVVDMRDALGLVTPGALVRLRCGEVGPEEVAARGGWIVAEAPRAPTTPSPQLPLFGR
jgi:DNA repair exonuclease SbcCD nuclease subunit